MTLSETSGFSRLQQAPGRLISRQGRQYLFFGGTAYLGLADLPEFIDLYKAGLDRYGVNMGSSRNNNVQLSIYPEAEHWAASRFGMPGALLMSSGYLAAQLCARLLQEKINEVFYAPGAHPALHTGAAGKSSEESTRLFSHWAKQTILEINRSTAQEFLVISNTINSLRPEKYDFSVFKAVDAGKRLHFLLDDSHGLGITGSDGVTLDYGVPSRPEFRTTVVASLAKGLGIDAGLILSDTGTLSYFRRNPVFLGASPPAPAAAYAFMHAGDLYTTQLKKLRENQEKFTRMLRMPAVYLPDFPVYYIDQPGLGASLLEKGVVISSFSYPSPSDPPFSRVVLSSSHTREDLQMLLEALHSGLQQTSLMNDSSSKYLT